MKGLGVFWGVAAFFFSCGKPSSYCYSNKPWLADTELNGRDSHKRNAVFIKQAF